MGGLRGVRHCGPNRFSPAAHTGKSFHPCQTRAAPIPSSRPNCRAAAKRFSHLPCRYSQRRRKSESPRGRPVLSPARSFLSQSWGCPYNPSEIRHYSRLHLAFHQSPCVGSSLKNLRFGSFPLVKSRVPAIKLGQIEPVLHCRRSSHLVCFLSLSALCPFRKIRIFRPLFVSERYAVMLHNPEFSSC